MRPSLRNDLLHVSQILLCCLSSPLLAPLDEDEEGKNLSHSDEGSEYEGVLVAHVRHLRI